MNEMTSAEASDEAFFRVSLTNGRSGVTAFLTATPKQWAAWMDALTPSGFKALVLLSEPLDYMPESSNPDEWAIVALIDRGLSSAEAEQGVAELAAKGYLPSEPMTLDRINERRIEHLRKPAAPESYPPCAVCGGIRSEPRPDAETYVVKRGEFVKVGMSTDFARRRAQLAGRDIPVIVPRTFDRDSMLTVLGHTAVLEHDLHERLADHHETGEWFRDSPALRAALHEAGVR